MYNSVSVFTTTTLSFGRHTHYFAPLVSYEAGLLVWTKIDKMMK